MRDFCSADSEFGIRNTLGSKFSQRRFVEWSNRVNACFGSNGNSVGSRMEEDGKKLKIRKMMIETAM